MEKEGRKMKRKEKKKEMPFDLKRSRQNCDSQKCRKYINIDKYMNYPNILKNWMMQISKNVDWFFSFDCWKCLVTRSSLKLFPHS